MKESQFIEQNKEKWFEFEKNLKSTDVDPARTSKLFIQITDDLSYARTFYPNRTVKNYLNGVAKLLFNDLNKPHHKNWRAFINFWKIDLPLTMFRERRAMLISFIVFAACFTLGMVTSATDKNFAYYILGHSYVHMTDENIAKGDPLAVYKNESETRTFLPILMNNLRIDFLTFFSGIFMAIGSLVIMVINGVMVGTFQYFFIPKGLFWESFLTIWTHGTLEISAIILSGGAGLALGRGLLFPGTLSRFQALKISGMNGLKIIMGVVPLTFMAALIEGFLTRHTDLPDIVRFLFILISLAFVLMYFYYYPKKVAKQPGHTNEYTTRSIIHKPTIEFDTTIVHTSGKLLMESFRYFFEHFNFFGRLLFLVPAICAVLIALNPAEMFRPKNAYEFASNDFFNFSAYPAIGVLNILCFVGVTWSILINLKNRFVMGERSSFANSWKSTGFTLVLGALFMVFLFFLEIDFRILISILIFPFIVFLSCTLHIQKISLSKGFTLAGSLIKQSWGRYLLCAFVFFVMTLITYLTTVTGVRMLLVQDALVMALTDNEGVARNLNVGFVAFQCYLTFLIYVILTALSSTLLFFTLREILTAEHLLNRIRKITAIK